MVPITVAATSSAVFRDELDAADCIYVAGGESFRLLYGLKSTGADRLLVEAVRNGKPYAGSSAGAIIAGPSVEPASVMDDPSVAPQLTDCSGLNLTEFVVVPTPRARLARTPSKSSAKQWKSTARNGSLCFSGMGKLCMKVAAGQC